MTDSPDKIHQLLMWAPADECMLHAAHGLLLDVLLRRSCCMVGNMPAWAQPVTAHCPLPIPTEQPVVPSAHSCTPTMSRLSHLIHHHVSAVPCSLPSQIFQRLDPPHRLLRRCTTPLQHPLPILAATATTPLSTYPTEARATCHTAADSGWSG